jgi:hypothetical protein
MFVSSFDRLLVCVSPLTLHSMRLVTTASGLSFTQPSTAIRLFCWVQGDEAKQRFPISVASTETVGELRKAIKKEKENTFREVDADTLKLWKVGAQSLYERCR